MKEILLKLRTENRYSQKLLAKELGSSRQAYMKYESGEVEPFVEIVCRISKELYVASPSPDYSATKTYSFEQINKLLDSLSFEQQKRTPGGLIGKFKMSEDFDDPLEDFKEYM